MADKSNSSGDKDKTPKAEIKPRSMETMVGGWASRREGKAYDAQNLERNPMFAALRSGGGWKREKTYKGRGGTR